MVSSNCALTVHEKVNLKNVYNATDSYLEKEINLIDN